MGGRYTGWMAARPIASGTISFGLVAIPVKLFSASQASEKISFNMLHAKCHSRLKQKYICPKDEETVERADMVKGYEFSKGQYVVFTDDELKALEEKRTESIEVAEFIPESAIDPLYYDKAYYLGPDKGGDRPYALLCTALRETGRVALCRYAARGKQYLVLIRPTAEGLVMQQLLYANEVRAFSEVAVPEATLKPEELSLAKLLIAQASSDEFHPERYEDETRKRVLAVIQQKIDGREIQSSADEEPTAQIIDLMEALKASLAKKEATPATPAAPSRSSRRDDDTESANSGEAAAGAESRKASKESQGASSSESPKPAKSRKSAKS